MEHQRKAVEHHRGDNNHAKYDAPDADIALSVFAKHIRAILTDVNDFRKRRNMKKEIPRVLLGCAGIVALSGLTFVAVEAAWGMYGKFAAASEARSDAEARLAQLKTQYANVEAQVAELNTDRGVEAAVRERYGVARPGEGEIDIVRHASTSESGGRGDESWFAKFWRSLFVW